MIGEITEKLDIDAERAATNGIKSRLMKCRPNCTGYMQNGCARVSLCVQTVRVYVSIMTTGASAWPRYLYEKTVPNKAFLSFFVFYVYQSLIWCKFCDNQCIFKLPHTTIPPFNQLVLNTFLFSFFVIKELIPYYTIFLFYRLYIVVTAHMTSYLIVLYNNVF